MAEERSLVLNTFQSWGTMHNSPIMDMNFQILKYEEYNSSYVTTEFISLGPYYVRLAKY